MATTKKRKAAASSSGKTYDSDPATYKGVIAEDGTVLAAPPDLAKGGGGPVAINGHHPACYFDNPDAPHADLEPCENGCAPIGAEE